MLTGHSSHNLLAACLSDHRKEINSRKKLILRDLIHIDLNLHVRKFPQN